MTKGVLPMSRAYMFAFDTIHAGVSEMPCENVSPPDTTLDDSTYEVENLS